MPGNYINKYQLNTKCHQKIHGHYIVPRIQLDNKTLKIPFDLIIQMNNSKLHNTKAHLETELHQ